MILITVIFLQKRLRCNLFFLYHNLELLQFLRFFPKKFILKKRIHNENYIFVIMLLFTYLLVGKLIRCGFVCW